MSSPEFTLFIPVISRAGSYDERPIISGYGELTGYTSFLLAERAGNAHLSRLDDIDALNVALSIMILKPSSIEQSLYVDDHWEGVK